MQISKRIKGVVHPSLSPQSNYLAVLTAMHLEIYKIPDLNLIRRFPTTCSTGTNMIWAPGGSRSSQRILLQTEDAVHIWDIRDPEWKATLSNGSGGIGKIVSVKFSHTGGEVLVFSEFGARLTVWSLDDVPSNSINGLPIPITLTQHVEIRDPKVLLNGNNTETCCAFRPRIAGLAPIFALLSRQGAQDVLSIHAPQTYLVLASVVLPTLDAQGLKWSPDGRWLVVWDVQSAGPKVLIYTADGNLFRTWSTGGDEDGAELGVKCLEWCPKSRYLAVGTYDGKVTVLGTRTFSPAIILAHNTPIQLSELGIIWQESASSSAITYQPVPQPTSPPAAPPSSKLLPLPRTGISHLAFDSSGRWVATRDDSYPSTVWIWDLDSLSAANILIQRAPVKSITWHPTRKGVLLIGCMQEEKAVYIWNCEEGIEPEGWTFGNSERNSTKGDVKWLASRSGKDANLVVLMSDISSALVAWPKGRTARDESEDDDSMDSVYEALMGRRYEEEDMIDDTFAGRGRFIAA